jgi:hypothetical protein
MWALCGIWEEGLEEVGEDWGGAFEIFGVEHWKCRTLIKREGRNEEKCMYFVCDFNGRWLKDLSFLCCIGILLRVEGRVVNNI